MVVLKAIGIHRVNMTWIIAHLPVDEPTQEDFGMLVRKFGSAHD